MYYYSPSPMQSDILSVYSDKPENGDFKKRLQNQGLNPTPIDL